MRHTLKTGNNMKATISIENVRGSYFFMNGEKLITSIQHNDESWNAYFHEFLKFKSLDEAIAGIKDLITDQAKEIGFEVEFEMHERVTEFRCGDNVYFSKGNQTLASVTRTRDRYLVFANGSATRFESKENAIAYAKSEFGNVEIETVIML